MKNLLHKKDSTAHAQRLFTWRNGIATLALTIVTTVAMAQVGIGTTNPDDSAALDVSATDKGFLPPRLDTSQRNGITTPAVGLTIFNTDKLCLEVFVGRGWRSMCGQVGATDVLNPATG